MHCLFTVNTPSPPKPVVEQPEEKQPDVPDESDKDIPLETGMFLK